eukprot:Hpha_TRINITY_DN10202_c0_g1::TRINITY_DN10202_c0_g1_i1::g.35117::m.35117
MAAAAAAADSGGKAPPEGWTKWRPRQGAYLDELEAVAQAECKGWVVQPVVVRNLSDASYTLVAQSFSWGSWAELCSAEVTVRKGEDLGIETQGTSIVSLTPKVAASGVQVGMRVVEVGGQAVQDNEGFDLGKIVSGHSGAECTLKCALLLAPPRQLEPWSVHNAVAQGSEVAPSGTSGYFVYRSSEGSEVCFTFNTPALWWRKVGAIAGPSGTDWAKKWADGEISAALETNGVGPALMPGEGKEQGPKVCVTAYFASCGKEACLVLEPASAVPPPPEDSGSGGAAAGGTAVDATYYDILGVQTGCSESAIRKGYYKKAQRWHPDKNKGDKEAEENFKRIGHAYAVLMDPERRRLYDQHGAEWMKRQEEHGGRAAVMRDSVDAMLGSGALKEEVGAWEVLRQVDPQFATERGKSEDALKREQDVRNAERIKSLAATLDRRVQLFVDNERRWWLELERGLKKKSAATPGSGKVVHLVGYAYRQTARQSMSRCCGVQAAFEHQRECCHRCGRDCALVCKYASIAHLQYWQQSWNKDLDGIERMADEIGNAPPARAREFAKRLERHERHWREKHKACADEIDTETLTLLEQAQRKIHAADLHGAAGDLRSASVQQRGRIEQEFQKRITAAGLSVLYEQGTSEAEEVARKSSALWLRLVRSVPEHRRGRVQAQRMLHALEMMGQAYMEAGEAGHEAVDFGDAANKVATS